MVNQFYVYALDAGFGPFFIKFGSYFPYTGRVCLNGHEYAKRRAATAGIGFTALDNVAGACRLDVAAPPAIRAAQPASSTSVRYRSGTPRSQASLRAATTVSREIGISWSAKPGTRVEC